MLRYEQYSVALISALPIEILAVELLLDRVHKKDVLIRGGSNLYTLGSICNHNVVVTCLPSGGYGTNSAAKVVTEMRSKFQSIHYGLLIGVAGGAPSPKHDIRLGDVVVSKPERGKGGVFQYDFFKDHPNGTQENIGFLDKPPNVLLSAVNSVCKNHLQGNSQAPPFADYIARICKTRPEFCAPGPAQDILFKPDYHHDPTEDTCSTCIAKGGTNIISRPPRGTSNPIVHYGIIGSGNRVVRDGETRDRIAAPHGILCFEMEAAGVLESFPCLVIRGISDYSDSHKNKAWQPYAALAAAAYAKELLSVASPTRAIFPVDDPHLKSVLDVLFVCYPEDERSDLIDRKGRRVPGTCEWFVNDTRYVEWSSGNASEVLVVVGGPGQGKTMLAIHLTRILEEISLQTKGTLLYFFCNSRDEKYSSGTMILRGLLYQLLKQNPHLFELVRSHFTTPNIQNYTISDVTPLWRVFIDLLRGGLPGPVYCVLDGLDECDMVSTQKLLTKVGNLASEPVPGLKMLFFCRKGLGWIDKKIGVFPQLELDPQRSDRKRYTSYLIKQLETHFAGDTLKKVDAMLQTEQEAAFLFIELFARYLKGKTVAEVERSLEDPPRDLDGMYRLVVSQIQDEQLVAPIIHWVVLSRRPMTIPVLATAIGIAASGSQGAEDILKSRMESCALLFTIDRNEVVHLVHKSAKDYLQRHDPLGKRTSDFFATDDKHLTLADTCLAWIQKGYETSKAFQVQESHPLVDYATVYWPEHLKIGSDALKTDLDLSNPLFQKRSRVRARWWKAYWVRSRYGEVPTSFTLLHLAAYFGITKLAQQLLETRNALPFQALRKEKDSYGRTPLFWAASRGHQHVMELLLRSGADINARDNHKMTPLYVAAMERHTGVIPFLLDHGADMTLQDDRGNTALTMGIKIGSKDVIKSLLKKNAPDPGSLARILPGLPDSWSFAHDCAPADELVRLQSWFLFSDWEKVVHHSLSLVGYMSALLKVKWLSKLAEKAIYTTLRRYEATDGEMALDLLTNEDSSRFMEQALPTIDKLLDTHGPKRLERFFHAVTGPLFRIQAVNKSVIEVLVRAFTLGIATAYRLEKTDVVDIMVNVAGRALYYGYQHDYFGIVQTIGNRVLSEWITSLMTHNTTHSTELITVGINIFVAIQYQGYTQFEQEISKVWVGKIQELLHGDLRDRAMQSFVAGCLNEISYRLKCGDLPRVSRHITTISSMAELGDEEFVEAWAVITGSIIHGLMAPGVGEGLQQVLGEWMSDLTPWRLQVLAEFLRQAKEDQTSLPPFIAVIGPRVLEEITKRGLRGGLKMEDFCIRAKA